MARVTVEDCLSKIPNCFELVLIASHRSKQIIDSGSAQIDSEGSKPSIVALREIALGLTDKKVMKEPITSEMSRDRSLSEMMHSKFIDLQIYDEDDKFTETVDGDDEQLLKSSADPFEDDVVSNKIEGGESQDA